MDLVSRLKTFLDSRQISVTQFADECCIPRPTGSQLLAGRNKKVSDEIICKIHNAYPELNVAWLMFGEGDMVSNANIEMSERQNAPNQRLSPAGASVNQSVAPTLDFGNESAGIIAEKKPTLTSDSDTKERAASMPGFGFDNTFTFAAPSDPTPEQPPIPTTAPPLSERSDSDARQTPDYSASEPDSITLTPGKGKRVTGIVVYYDDCTYESFIPDPNHSHPFIAR